METPICDFVRNYADRGMVRMHMPGHKGKPADGPERMDITEIGGADELYRARGIIRRSEENASALFGTERTVYATEGSSLCIRAMLYLALLSAGERGIEPVLLAGRNAHRTLMTAAALLGVEVDWLLPSPVRGSCATPLSCRIDCRELERRLSRKTCMAVYLTSPDYLGHRADLEAAAEICHRHGVPLLVDNAHGAYLKFLTPDVHPISLGADLCCDSAHKTLSCLTGAAYLHLSHAAPEPWRDRMEEALSLFASTSPSYLTLASLDRMNRLLAEDYPARLQRAVQRLEGIKKSLLREGWFLEGDEPLKLTLKAADRGYTGRELQERLRQEGLEAEFADREYLVLMPSAETEESEWRSMEEALRKIPARPPLRETPPELPRPVRVCSIREAMLAPGEWVPTEEAVGRVLADAALSCPPAVPVVMAGERITADAADCMSWYGITRCRVMRSQGGASAE